MKAAAEKRLAPIDLYPSFVGYDTVIGERVLVCRWGEAENRHCPRLLKITDPYF